MSTENKTKGEITKEKILDATLELISESGIETLSHRNIAKRADIRLSLTSYYFGNLDNLICEAFDRFFEREKLAVKELEAQVEQALNDSAINKDTSKLIDAVTEVMMDYIMSSHHGPRHAQASIDSAFYFSLNQSPKLSERLERFNRYLHKAICRQLSAFTSDKSLSELDASLILSIVRELEHQASNRNIEIDRNKLKQKFARILFLIVRN